MTHKTLQSLQRRALRCVEEVMSETSPHRTGSAILGLLDDVVGYDTAGFISLETPSLVYERHTDINQLHQWRQNHHRYRHDLRKVWGSLALHRHVGIDRELAPENVRDEMPLFREYIYPWGIRTSLVVGIAVPQRACFIIGMGRGGPGASFSESQIEAIRPLYAVLASATEILYGRQAHYEVQPPPSSGSYPSSQAPIDRLTKRQREVADLAILGLPYSEIAGALKIQVQTVKNHMRQVFHVTGTRNRAELGVLLRRGRRKG